MDVMWLGLAISEVSLIQAAEVKTCLSLVYLSGSGFSRFYFPKPFLSTEFADKGG